MGSQLLQNTEIIKQTDILLWKIRGKYESFLYLAACEEITNFRMVFFSSSCLCPALTVSVLYFEKKNRNRLREYLKIRNVFTYQITFIMTCQQHSFKKKVGYKSFSRSSILLGVKNYQINGFF